MRTKNEGRWKWLLLKNRSEFPPSVPPTWLGVKSAYYSKYKVVKTGASRYDGAYALWETIGEYDDPKVAYAMLELINVSNKRDEP
jgi:hypothetical protein